MALWSRFFHVRPTESMSGVLFFSIIDTRRWDLRESIAVKLRMKRCMDVLKHSLVTGESSGESMEA